MEVEEDRELHGSDDPHRPKFKVTSVPQEFELVDLAKQELTEALTALDLANVRVTMNPRRSRFGDLAHQPEKAVLFRGIPDTTIRICQTEEEPSDLAFIVGCGRFVSMFVVVMSSQFDRTDPAQDTAFKKCLGLLDLICEAPVNPKAEEQERLVGSFYVRPNINEDERTCWREIRSRWPAE
jgi:hypothetical protein